MNRFYGGGNQGNLDDHPIFIADDDLPLHRDPFDQEDLTSFNRERPMMSDEETEDMVRRMQIHEHPFADEEGLPASMFFDSVRHAQPSASGGFSPLDSFYPATTADRDLGQDEDPEVQRILALSAATNREELMQEEFIRSTVSPTPVPPAPVHPASFQPRAVDSDIDRENLELQRLLALSAATNRERLLQDEFIRSTANRSAADGQTPPPPPPPRPQPQPTGDDDEAAFMEAAIMASLEQAQPAADDEDDPLLAQALKASLETDATDPAAAAAASGPLFPHLRAQQEAEARAAARLQAGGGAAFGPGDYEPLSFAGAGAGVAGFPGAADFPAEFLYDDDDIGAPPPPPRPVSEHTLESRRLRQDQDDAYEESLAEDRAKEESRLEAIRREKCAARRRPPPPAFAIPRPPRGRARPGTTRARDPDPAPLPQQSK